MGGNKSPELRAEGLATVSVDKNNKKVTKELIGNFFAEAVKKGTEVYRGAPGLVSMAGLPERHAPGRVVAVEGGIEARLGASSTAGSTDAHDRHRPPPPPAPARRPPRRCRAAARPHHLRRAAARRRDHPRRPRHRRDPGGRAVAGVDHLLLVPPTRPL